MRYVASCSCGKDSLAMCYRIMAENLPLNEIVFYDTGMEFDAIYRNWDKLRKEAECRGIKCVVLQPKEPFLFSMFERKVVKRDGTIQYGYSWCGGMCRWGTKAKITEIDKYCESEETRVYVGIAADEKARLQKERKPYKLFPLAEWGMTEADCLAYCRSIGIGWDENGKDLYDILDRVSCWCCRNKNLWELYNYYSYLPEYWEKLKALQKRTDRPFKQNATIMQLEERFRYGLVPKHRTKDTAQQMMDIFETI